MEKRRTTQPAVETKHATAAAKTAGNAARTKDAAAKIASKRRITKAPTATKSKAKLRTATKSKAKPRTATKSKAKLRTATKRKAKPRTATKSKAKLRTATKSKATSGLALKGLAVLWAVNARGQAAGLHVDDREVWAGWDTGNVAALDHGGQVLRRWRLPAGVDALIADERWRYAGCRDGNVYDLSSTTPRVAYEVAKDSRILAIDVFRSTLCVADSSGACTVLDAEQNLLWKHDPGASSGWMVRAEDTGVYLGHSRGVSALDWQGALRWQCRTAWVGYGWNQGGDVYVFAGPGTTKAAVVRIDKRTGKVRARGSCVSKNPKYSGGADAAACAASPHGEFFGATREFLFCFDKQGRCLWEVALSIGAPCSMAWHHDRLYVVTHTGVLACLDVSAAAIAVAVAKAPARITPVSLGDIKLSRRTVATAPSGSAGVVLECVRDGSTLRVRVVSDGYRSDWFCQFPRDIREVGSRYLVDAVQEASQGGFYRVVGEIRRM